MVAMPARDISHSRRKYLRFSVRGLIVLVLVIGTWLGWIVRSAHIQREAVAAITKAGGSVKYNYGRTSGSYIPGGKPSKPGWLVGLIGIDYFDHVTEVWILSHSTAPDAALVHVGRLTQLQRLTLYRSSLSDAGLANLKGLTKLSYLNLGETQVTDTWLANLKGLTKLSCLDLGGTQVTDAGLADLTGLTNLSILGLGHTHVTDAGLVHLKRLMSLSSLGLAGTQVTNAGVEELQQASPSLTIFH
jgi:hypothetical protein